MRVKQFPSLVRLCPTPPTETGDQLALPRRRGRARPRQPRAQSSREGPSPGGLPRRAPAALEEEAGGIESRLDRELLRHPDLNKEVQEHIRLGLEAQDRESGEWPRRLEEQLDNELRMQE